MGRADRTGVWRALLACACAALGGCGAMQVSPTDGGGACAEGQARACPCAGGGKGVETCTGGRFGACTGCPSAPAGEDAAPDAGPRACATCEGCCSGGRCIAFEAQDPGQCGLIGSACQACPPAALCVNGACVTEQAACDPASCPGGCCLGSTCIPPARQGPMACGTAGAACMACAGVSCAAGACTDQLRREATFRLRVKALSVMATDGAGSPWDGIASFPGKPDPYVYVTTPSGAYGESEPCDDTLTCQPGDLVMAGGVPLVLSGAELEQGIAIVVFDDDGLTSPDDLMGRLPLFATTTWAATYQTGPFGGVIDLGFELVP